MSVTRQELDDFVIDILHKVSRRTLLQVESDSLAGAILAGEYLIHADLSGSNLSHALLPFANLSGADLSRTNLTRANLRGANLTEVDLTGADFFGANLTGATLSLTVLHDCRNLHQAVGLELVHHRGPSVIDLKTLAASAARLPYNFLRGAGFTRSEIADMHRQFPAL